MKILLDNGCDLSLKDKDGRTADDVAVSKGFHDIIRLITQKKVGFNQGIMEKIKEEIKEELP